MYEAVGGKRSGEREINQTKLPKKKKGFTGGCNKK